MRILLLHHGYPPEGEGGSELYTRSLARRLAHEHDVAVLYPTRDPGRGDGELAESRRDGVRVLALNDLREPSGFESYRDPGSAARAARVLDVLAPELVHVGHLSGLSTRTVFDARQRGAAVVITLHDFWPVCPLGQLLNLRLEVCPGPTPRRCLGCVGAQVAAPTGALRRTGRGWPLAGPAVSALARLAGRGSGRIASRLEEMFEVMRAADALISPSRFLRDRLAALGVAGIRVVPNGRDALSPATRERARGGRLRVGFLGSAIPSKGVHVLAEAWRRLADPSVELEVRGRFLPYHGDTGYEARVRALLGAAADSVLRGPLPHADVGEWLARRDVLVVPSIWEENAPLTVQEAFLAGCPVVVSGHGGLAELVREGSGGLRFRPGDARDLARVLARLRDEPALLEELAGSAPPVPTMDEHVAALASVYEAARARHRRRPGRPGVVVIDHRGAPETVRALRSALSDPVRPRVLVVRNGGPEPPALPEGVERLDLAENRGFAGGANAGIEALVAAGCDRVLLLNNDAWLEPGALRRLAEALDDSELAGVGPVVVREPDGRVESRGIRLDPSWGRHRLLGSGEAAPAGEGRRAVDALSGAALMLSASSYQLVGPLDEAYFLYFEDADWCARARRAGLRLEVVLGARARHLGGRGLGPASADRLYYAARNHLRAVERSAPQRSRAQAALRRAAVAGWNLAHALRQHAVPRREALAAVARGVLDHRRGRFGPLAARGGAPRRA